MLLCSCNNPNLTKQTGYIVFNYAEYFQFVPTKTLDLSTSISSFYSENLENGIMFSSKSIGDDYDTIFAHIDTFRLEKIDNILANKFKILKIVPVRIEYVLDKSIIPSNIYTVNYIVKGRHVHFTVQFCKPVIKKIITLNVKKLNKEGTYIEDINVCPR